MNDKTIFYTELKENPVLLMKALCGAWKEHSSIYFPVFSLVLSRSNILQSVWFFKRDSLNFFSFRSKRKGKKFPNFDPQTEPQIQVVSPTGERVFHSLESKTTYETTILIVSFSFS